MSSNRTIFTRVPLGNSRKTLPRDLGVCLFPPPLNRSVYQNGNDENVLVRVKKMCVPAAAVFLFQTAQCHPPRQSVV